MQLVQENIMLDCEGRYHTAASITDALTLTPYVVNMSVNITL